MESPPLPPLQAASPPPNLKGGINQLMGVTTVEYMLDEVLATDEELAPVDLDHEDDEEEEEEEEEEVESSVSSADQEDEAVPDYRDTFRSLLDKQGQEREAARKSLIIRTGDFVDILASNSSTPTSSHPADSVNQHLQSTLERLTGTVIEPVPPLTNAQLKLVRKTLITKQIRKELALLLEMLSIRPLQPPSFPDPTTPYITPTPLLNFHFHRNVLTFPFFKASNSTFWVALQRLLDEVRRRGLGRTREPLESLKRKRIYYRIERNATMAFCTAVKLSPGREAPDELTTNPYSPPNSTSVAVTSNADASGLTVDVITVREIVEQKRLQKHRYPEFLLKTVEHGGAPVYALRTFAQLTTLHQTLQRAYPHIFLPPLPKQVVSGKAARKVTLPKGESYADIFYAEKDRLLVRVYFKMLLKEAELVRSPQIRAFLLENYCEPGFAELQDAEKRAHFESIKQKEIALVKEEAERRVNMMEQDLVELRKELMSPGGTERMLKALETIADLTELPAHYQCVFDWGRISFAAFLYRNYYAGDFAAAKLQALKRMHGMMPYKTIKAILHISNPTRMAKAMMDLFLARPFGGRSLMQRMVNSSLTEEIKFCVHEISLTEKFIEPSFCKKIKAYVQNVDQRYKDDKNHSDDELLTKILRDRTRPPMLTEVQLAQIWPDGLTAPPDQLLWQRLRRLLALENRRRDKEQMIQLVHQPVFTEFLKELVMVVYAPLSKVYLAANIANNVMDVAEFLNDLISTIERLEQQQNAEMMGSFSAAQVMASKSRNPLDPFIDLCEKHQQTFYHFVHRVYSRDRDGLFRQLASWLSFLQTFLRDGLQPPINIQALLDREISLRDHADLRADLEAMSKHRLEQKQRRHQKMKERIARGEPLLWREEDKQLFIEEFGMDEVSVDDAFALSEELGTLEDEHDDVEKALGGYSGARRTTWRATKLHAFKEKELKEPNLKIIPRIQAAFMQDLLIRVKRAPPIP